MSSNFKLTEIIYDTDELSPRSNGSSNLTERQVWETVRLRDLGKTDTIGNTFVVDANALTQAQITSQNRMHIVPLGELLHDSQLLLQDVLLNVKTKHAMEQGPWSHIDNIADTSSETDTATDGEGDIILGRQKKKFGWLRISFPEFKQRRHQLRHETAQQLSSQRTSEQARSIVFDM